MQAGQSIVVRLIIVLTVLVAANSASAYYSPRQGRFLSRDPIGEKGGLNLCVFALNGPTNHVDALGFMALPPGTWRYPPAETTCPAEIYVYIDGHGCKAVDNNTGESFYTGQIGKGDKGCNSGDFVSPNDVRQATDAVLGQYDATELVGVKVVLVLRTCGMGTHVPEMRQLASLHKSIKTICGCTSLYWATGGWGWCWSKWVCTNVNGY